MTPGVAVVVDASVARAAGGAGATHGASSACRDVLLALRDADLRVAMSPPLHDEWRRHVSRFTRKWLASMYARRRVLKLTPDPFAPLHAACAELPEGRSRRAIEKDLHLVDAAFAADRRVLSNDGALRHDLQGLATRVTTLRRLLWGDPTEGGCIAWVRAGTPDEPRHRLHAAVPRTTRHPARAARR
jgi:hypothetical protein